jgi:hypothetical protein
VVVISRSALVVELIKAAASKNEDEDESVSASRDMVWIVSLPQLATFNSYEHQLLNSEKSKHDQNTIDNEQLRMCSSKLFYSV